MLQRQPELPLSPVAQTIQIMKRAQLQSSWLLHLLLGPVFHFRISVVGFCESSCCRSHAQPGSGRVTQLIPNLLRHRMTPTQGQVQATGYEPFGDLGTRMSSEWELSLRHIRHLLDFGDFCDDGGAAPPKPLARTSSATTRQPRCRRWIACRIWWTWQVKSLVTKNL